MFKATDKRLVEQALKGKTKAWTQLVERYEQRVFHYGLRMMPSRDDALDLLQDTFTSVFKSLSSWDANNAFKPWLMTIAHRRCVEFYRRRREYDSWSEEHETTSPASDSCPELSYNNDQQLQLLLQALHRLPMDQRVVVEAKFFQQLTTREIAERQGDSENTIKSRLYSGLEKLKMYLEGVYEQA